MSDTNISTEKPAAPANDSASQSAQATPTSAPGGTPANPFAGAQTSTAPATGNPFATNQQATTSTQGQQMPAAPARTGIPVLNRGGGPPRGGRGSGIPQRGGRGGALPGGQNRTASVGSLNPGASNFQPQAGNKRPSESGESGIAKRQQRGGRGGGGASRGGV